MQFATDKMSLISLKNLFFISNCSDLSRHQALLKVLTWLQGNFLRFGNLERKRKFDYISDFEKSLNDVTGFKSFAFLVFK